MWAGGSALAAESEEPNGSMTTCAILRKDVEVGSDRVTLFAGRDETASTLTYVLPLPSASDWKVQCDGQRFFWALSSSQGMQVSINPYPPAPGEDTSPRTYLAALGARLKEQIETNGHGRVTRSVMVELVRDTVFGVEMTIDAPPGEKWPLFPQDTFWTTQPSARGPMLDLHLTTYYRTAGEQETRRSAAHKAMGAFATTRGLPASPLKAGSISLPSFPGISARSLSERTLAGVKAALGCDQGARARYCEALGRFVRAAPLSPGAAEVWAGSALQLVPDEKGGLAGEFETVHYLFVKGGRAALNAVKPSNKDEADELKALLEGIRAGKRPSRESGLGRYLAGLRPRRTAPVEVKEGSLSFLVDLELPADVPSPPSVVAFVRETAGEVLVLEIMGEGHGLKIAVFPKQ